MALAIIDHSPPLDTINLGKFGSYVEHGNQILYALGSNEVIPRSLNRLYLGGDPRWWLHDTANLYELISRCNNL